jgi:predicted N-acetyltransferase YhbS
MAPANISRISGSYIAPSRTQFRKQRGAVGRIENAHQVDFLNAEHAGGDEALLVCKLRGCATFVPELDYVAELEGTVVGNIMYTRNKVIGENGEWSLLTLGPVSVLPKYQRDGVGSALIRKTLDLTRELGYRAVLIFGHQDYYSRFGFKPASEYGITTAEGKNFPAFMALPLYGVCPGKRRARWFSESSPPQ